MQGYRELVIEGKLPVVKAFLTGLQLGRRWATGCFFSEELRVVGESRGHKILEKLHVDKNVTHAVVTERHVEAVVAAIKDARKELKIVVRRNRKIHRVQFAYSFAVYNRRLANRLRKVMETMSTGLEADNFEEREIVHPEGAGIEAYSPEHDYEYKGRGVVQGPFEELIAYRDALDRLEFTKVEPVSLILG